MSAIDTNPESFEGDSATLQSQRIWKAAGIQDLDFDSQRLRNRLRAKMFGVDASPINIGRFTVLETVGSGGMGVVYAAYDQELDRRVAVKLLRSSHEEDASIGKGRLLREAQALAKLSHPNVVQIYDVGTFNERVFLAMEFLPGLTMREWLREEPRPWREILRHFADAGQGLVAAHREGIIHRDFKPANLLFGGDDRLRVVDFGLARATEHARVMPEETTTPSGRALEVELTQTGEILGTPAYMSPEQARHESIDARSDQYSFCVALYEALFGHRPHVGKSTAEVLVAVAEGDVRSPPRNTKVPARIARAIMRGLSVDPDRRFPSMDVLLAELSLDRKARWRWLGGGALAATSLGVFFFIGQGGQKAPCQSQEDTLGGVWGPKQRAALESSFVASGAHQAKATAARVGRQLDAYAGQWADARLDVCEAHHVRRERSAPLHDLQMACLLERRAELRTLAQAFAEADALIVEHAPGAVVELSPVSACQDLERVQARGGVGHEQQQLRMRLAEAQARYKAGRYTDALDAIESIVRDAREQGAVAVEAEAHFHRGIIQERRTVDGAAIEAFETSADLAEEAGRDELAARAGMRVARQQAMQEHYEKADWSLRLADSKVRRLGNNPELRLALLESHAAVAWHAKRYDEAIEKQRLAIEERRERLGDDDPRLGEELSQLANYLGEAGQDGAAEARAEARVIFVRAYGSEHPRLAKLLVNLAIDQSEAGMSEEARASFVEAERIVLASLGSEAPTLIIVNKALAQLALERNDLDEAERRGKRTLELAALEETSVGHRLDGLAVLSTVSSRRGEHEQTVAHLRAYLGIVESSSVHGDYKEYARYGRGLLAESLLELERYAEAADEARNLLRALEGNLGYPELEVVARQVIADAEAALAADAPSGA